MQTAALGVTIGAGDDMLGFGGCQGTGNPGRDADGKYAFWNVLMFCYQGGGADDSVRANARV